MDILKASTEWAKDEVFITIFHPFCNHVSIGKRRILANISNSNICRC